MHIHAARGYADRVIDGQPVTLGIRGGCLSFANPHNRPLLSEHAERADRRGEPGLAHRGRHLAHHLLVDVDGERVAEMSATPTTEAPVSKLVDAPPAVTVILE